VAEDEGGKGRLSCGATEGTTKKSGGGGRFGRRVCSDECTHKKNFLPSSINVAALRLGCSLNGFAEKRTIEHPKAIEVEDHLGQQ